MSIDGFVGGPNGEMSWLFKSMSESGKAWIKDTLAGAGLHIMGSKTFYDMIAYWPYSHDLLAAPMNDIPKAVFTKRGLSEQGKTTRAITDTAAADEAKGVQLAKASNALVSWKNAIALGGDMAEEIKQLKVEDGDYILAHGGADFAQNLIATGLVDEFRLVIHPVMLGSGLPIFSKLPGFMDVELISATTFESGVVAAVYRPKSV